MSAFDEAMTREYEEAGLVPERDLTIIEGEILFYKRQAGQSIIEIGKRLTEAKEQLEHGEWLVWLREKVDISERHAQNFMRIAKEYANTKSLADLGAAKALALLALPVSEREGFAAEKHEVNGIEKTVEEMTSRELKQAIAERDNALKSMEDMKARMETAEQSREKMEQDMAQLRELSRRAKETAEQKTQELAEAERELKELREKPVDVAVQDAAPEQLAQARAEAEKEAGERYREYLEGKEKEIKELEEDLRKANEQAEKAGEKLQAAERAAKEAKDAAAKASKMAQVNGNENMVKFSVLFRQAQDIVNQMAGTVEKEGEENQGKMKAALNALAQAIGKVAE